MGTELVFLIAVFLFSIRRFSRARREYLADMADPENGWLGNDPKRR